MSIKNIIYFLPVLFLLLYSCAPELIKEEAPLTNEIKAGKKFRINLKEDHKAGETWKLKDDIDQDCIEHLNTVWHGSEKGIDVNFLATHEGKTTIELFLIRQKDTVAVKQFIVDIRSK